MVRTSEIEAGRAYVSAGQDERLAGVKGTPALTGITVRGMLISLVALVILSLIIQRSEYFLMMPGISTVAMPSPAAMAVLFCCLGLNALLRAFKRYMGLSQAELITIYSLVAFGGFVLSMGFIGNIIIRIVAVPTLVLQQPSQPWGEVLARISPLAVPSSQEAIVDFWRGGSVVPWRDWWGR